MSNHKFKKDPLVLIDIINNIYREYGLYLEGTKRVSPRNKGIYKPTGSAQDLLEYEYEKKCGVNNGNQ